ncbi:MAG: M48 family metallopeptidase [Anaerolineales bacterium]|nr:M48 family metallopeptidase [Anaerolineales bacterium]
METAPQELDAQRQDRAREYARIRRRLMLLNLVLGFAYLSLWLLLGWARSLQPALAELAAPIFPAGPPWWVMLLLTATAIGLPWSIATSPLSYYRGFVLPHRFDLSTQDLRGWLVDQAKGMAVSTAIGVPLLIGLFSVIRETPDTWWLWAAALYTVVTAVLAALAPVLLLPIFFDVEDLPDEYRALRERLVTLAEAAGTRIEGVFQIDMSRRTKEANAALAGLGKTRRILLGDTLLESFSADEIETVLAHELAHHVHGDIPILITAQAVLNFGAFYLVSVGLGAALGPLSLDGPADPAGLPLIALLLGAFALVTMPLTNGFSRWRERLADEYALNLTRKPEAFMSAMRRLANQNLAEADPERWVVWLLASHPPLRDRIERAERKEELYAQLAAHEDTQTQT